MPKAVDLTDHAVNRAHLRTLVDKLASDSDYNSPPRILRRDLIVIFLYLDEPHPPPKDLREMEELEKEEERVRKNVPASVHGGSGTANAAWGMRAGEEESEEGDLGAGETDEDSDADSSVEESLYTSWTDCLQLMAKITTKFPYYIQTMEELWQSPPDLRNMLLDAWRDAFAHYELPLQRRVRHKLHFHVHYRLNMNDAAQYLHQRGHLFPPRYVSFLSLPVEVRAMIWKLVFTYPVSGVQFCCSDKDGELEPRMYTVSRDLNAKVSLGQFLERRFGDVNEEDQVMPGIALARMMTDSLYKISAPMAISKALNIEAARGFLENNMFVFTKALDMRSFFKRGAAGKRRNLCHVAFVMREDSVREFTRVCEDLALCVELKKLHLFFARGSAIRSMPDFREGFLILSRHAKLKAIHCSANATEAIPSRHAAVYIAQVMSEQVSSFKTYFDETLMELEAKEDSRAKAGEKNDED